VDNKETKDTQKDNITKEEDLKKTVDVEVEEMEDVGEIRHLPYYDMHSITALILSLFAILSPFMVFGFGGLLGVVLGVIALYQVRQSRKEFDNDMNHTAKVLAVIGLVISGASLIISVFILTSVAWRMNSFSNPSFFNMRPRVTYYHRFW
jgi:cytochrome bd-type quinol oxidase subunit 2